LSLASDIMVSPSCSVDSSTVPPDNSYCLLEDSSIPPEKPCPDVKKSFDDLFKEATLFFQSFLVGETDIKEYKGSGLKGSKEEIVFYEEYIEPPPSLVLTPPVLFLVLNGPRMIRSRPVLIPVIGRQ